MKAMLASPIGDDEGDDLDLLGVEPLLEDSELFEEVQIRTPRLPILKAPIWHHQMQIEG